MLPAYATVNGVATTTFQTGDTINGSGSTNTLNVTNAAAGNNTVAASVNNVGNFNVKNVIAVGNNANSVTFNQVLSNNIANFNVTTAVTGASTLVTNGSAATVYGNSAGAADTLSINLGAGNVNRTLSLALNGAGVAGNGGTNSTVTYVGTTATDINSVAINVTGNNFVTLNSGANSNQTNVKTFTVTGAGNANLNLASLIATASSTSAVTVDASAATGSLVTLDLGGAFNQFDVVKGSTAAGLTYVGGQVTGVQSIVPANWTNIDGFQVDAGSTGTLILTGSTLAAIRDFETTGNNNLTVTNLASLPALTFVGTGAQGNQASGTITLNGASLTGTADTLAIGFDNFGTAASSTQNWTIGGNNGTALGLSGAETLTINTLGGIGASGTLTLNGITDQGLKALSVTSVGNVALGTVTANTAGTANVGTILTVDATNVAKAFSATFSANALANGATVLGAVGNNTLTFGIHTGSAAIVVTTGAGNDTISYTTGGAATTSSFTINSGNGNDSITTGSGNDTIIVGNGANTITAGAGVNSITLGAHTGNVDTIVYNAAIGTTAGVSAGNSDTISGFSISGLDKISFSASGAVSTNANGNQKIVSSNATANTAATAVSAGTVTKVADWDGTGQLNLTAAAADGTNMVNYTGAATTAAALKTLVTTANTGITYGGGASTAGQALLIEYLSSVDSTLHIAAIVLADGTATNTTNKVATAVTDIVLTGISTTATGTHLGTGNYAFVA